MNSVVKSTITLSRNIDKYPFPAGLTYDASELVEKEIIEALNALDSSYQAHMLVNLDENEKELLFAQKLITYNMVRNTIQSSVMAYGEGKSIRINDEDHLAIVQESFTAPLRGLWTDVSDVEQSLSPVLNFAFDLKLGYLTSRITDIGTGLKIAVILHLPATTRTGYMKKLMQAVHQVGFSLKEYTLDVASGNHGYYELSNLITIGKSENELIESMEELIDKIEKKENDALETLMSADDKMLEDEVFRAYGLLKNARLMTYEESIALISKARLGVTLDLLKDHEAEVLDSLLFSLHPKLFEEKQLRLIRKGEALRSDYIRAHLGAS